MLQLTNVHISYPTGGLLRRIGATIFPKAKADWRATALDDFTLWLGRGESFAVMGAPESGKTTLLRLVAGIIPPGEGHCSVEGRVSSAIRGEDALVPTETGEQNVLLRCALQGLDTDACVIRAAEVERMAGLAEQYKKPVEGYDDAMRARLSMSIALAEEPALLVISNTLEHCGFPYIQRYVVRMRHMLRNGMTLLIESTDYPLLSRLCESAIWLRDGKLQQVGLFDLVYNANVLPRLQHTAQQVAVAPEGRAQPAEGMAQPAKGTAQPPPVQPAGWMAQQQAAFSEPLAPNFSDIKDRQSSPQDVRRALEDAQGQVARLNALLTDYARANLAYEEENKRLQAAVVSEKVRADAAQEQAERLLESVQDTLRVMHRQFVRIGNEQGDGQEQ